MTRATLPTMGTVASVELPEAYLSLLPQLAAALESVEAIFSLYRPDTQASRVAAGSLALTDTDDEFRATYSRAVEWRSRTGGAFTPNRPDGAIDLGGLVKAEAIASCAELLDAAGCPAYAINVGGDILVTGSDPVPIGITDPHSPGRVLAAIELDRPRRAVATSGSAERGDHIWSGGFTGPAEFVQVTVVADDIVVADVLATAIVAGGSIVLDELTDVWDIDVLAVDPFGGLLATEGFRRALAA